MAVKQRPAGGKNTPQNNPEDGKLYESPEALRGNIENFTERNAKPLIIAFVLVAVAVAGFFLYTMWKDNQATEAQAEMFQAQFYFEADSLNLALNGDGNYPGFLQIIDKFGGTPAANLAHFYAGAAYLKQGQYQEAVDHLQDFSSDDILVQARAYALEGDAYMEMEKFEAAADAYQKAAEYESNKSFSPQYMSQAAMAYELAGDNAAALALYTEVVDNYYGSSEYENARKQQARLQAMTGATE
jgi:tetratricopeptide (TPR) repeat protein